MPYISKTGWNINIVYFLIHVCVKMIELMFVLENTLSKPRELWHRKGLDPCFIQRGTCLIPSVCVANGAGLLKALLFHPAWPCLFLFHFFPPTILFLSAVLIKHLYGMRQHQYWPKLVILVKICHSHFSDMLHFKAQLKLSHVDQSQLFSKLFHLTVNLEEVRLFLNNSTLQVKGGPQI